MNTYKHLNLFEREIIMILHYHHYTLDNIAQQLNRHKSTISRELRRLKQADYSATLATLAELDYQRKRLPCRPHRKQSPIRLSSFLDENWSPEQI